MAVDVDKAAIVGALAEPARVMTAAAALGRSLAGRIDRIYLVGCGAPNRIMLGLEYWLQHHSPSLEVRRYFPAEFVTQNPARFDERTLSGGGTRDERSSIVGGGLPRRDVQLVISQRQGRGTVYVAQQPNAFNGYTAVIRVRDPQGGYGFYDFEVDYR